MKNNIKALQLIESGLSSKTVSKLTESQINELHSKMVGEQTSSKATTFVSSKNPNASSIAKNLNAQGVNVSMTETDGEMEEGKKKRKKSEPNPWAICHAQVGPKKTIKFERCVQSVKKSLKEGKNPVSLFLENEIMRIVEKHIPPRITKRDLLNYLMETETAPAKPITKPTTKPGTKPRPKNPGQNPNPGEKEAPRAISPERAKTEVINAIMKILDNE
jgi:hypothetical protein